MPERRRTDSGYAIRDGDRGEDGAIIERMFPDRGYTVGGTFVLDRSGDSDGARVRGIKIRITLISHCHGVATKFVVINAINLKVVGKCTDAA